LGHRAIEITKAAIIRLEQLNELYKNSKKKEKDEIRKAIMSLVYYELREEFNSFLNLKAIDDSLSGSFNIAYTIQKESDEKRADFILRGGADKYNPSYTDKEMEEAEDEAPF
jgi:hypothetical protein